jgi:hypothetical protein
MNTPPTVYASTTGTPTTPTTTTQEEVEEYMRSCIINQQKKVHGTERALEKRSEHKRVQSPESSVQTSVFFFFRDFFL